MLNKAKLETRQALFEALKAANVTLEAYLGKSIKVIDLTEDEAQQIIKELSKPSN